ncbi:L,D-transpeptidase [Thiocapsa bogorovii]|uniref:L,D-transpeptidase n=1 Tax=Thiocapsa bogorovii TaxID=521689 RepID=UPI001E40CF63|nr:L,D-transpeptidase [Thiocapsa bogorovii]UHD16428.1 L,D-transpeptidase [Thiocapsa bogorovii]
MALCLCLGLLGAGCGPRLATKADNVAHVPNPMLNANYSEDAEVPFVMEPKTAKADGSRQANFESESASRRTRDMADWVVSSRDNLNQPFAIVDKVNAKVYVFGVDGRLHGAAPVLLGLAQGDHSVPGIGNMRLSRIPSTERTTPAGRFVTSMGRNSHGKEILWLDYENAISMHPVITSNPKERRAERLETPTPLDNRISFGCINVPVNFFKKVIYSKFSGTV